MQYSHVIPGTFLERPNRFIARVLVDEREETVHVKNTGRCRELLVPGATVYLSVSDNPARKTGFDLIAVEKILADKTKLLVNMDSQIPNDVAYEWLKKGRLFSSSAIIRREVRHGNSRFDLQVTDGDRTAFIEVKGVTLERNGTAMFPDAPTERGTKHVKELTEWVRGGGEAYILFVIQMKGIHRFTPNRETDPTFGAALREARDVGVRVLALDCITAPDSIEADAFVPVIL